MCENEQHTEINIQHIELYAVEEYFSSKYTPHTKDNTSIFR